MKLTAIWVPGTTLDDLPDHVVWEDGRTGTIEEYLDHRNGTYRLVRRKNGRTEMHIFPEIVAEAYYCAYGRTWGVRGDGVEATSIPVNDPEATDSQIRIALMSVPMNYRVRITR